MKEAGALEKQKKEKKMANYTNISTIHSPRSSEYEVNIKKESASPTHSKVENHPKTKPREQRNYSLPSAITGGGGGDEIKPRTKISLNLRAARVTVLIHSPHRSNGRIPVADPEPA